MRRHTAKPFMVCPFCGSHDVQADITGGAVRIVRCYTCTPEDEPAPDSLDKFIASFTREEE